jgi:hypothetical protein
MTRVAGVDGIPGGWAVVIVEADRWRIQKRASSVFPAPVRPVLAASSWEDACARSRASAPKGKAISKQTFHILQKIKEVDDLLQAHPRYEEVIEVAGASPSRGKIDCPMRNHSSVLILSPPVH